MVATRPYRAALPTDVAVRELRAAAGTQFDPTVVEAFAQELEARTAGAAAAPDDLRLATVRAVAHQLQETLARP